MVQTLRLLGIASLLASTSSQQDQKPNSIFHRVQQNILGASASVFSHKHKLSENKSSSSTSTLNDLTEDASFWGRNLASSVIETYELKVTYGLGDGIYEAGAKVEIIANPCDEGSKFDKWVVVSGNPEIEDRTSTVTTLTMPAEDVRVGRKCMDAPMDYKLTVKNGDGDGMYEAGDMVTVTANEPMEGSEFIEWKIEEGDPAIDDLTSSTTQLKMPAEDVVIKATYTKPAMEYKLTVKSGDGDGMYEAGDTVTVTANEPMEGSEFIEWKVEEGDPTIDDLTSPTTELKMPEEDVVIKATYTKPAMEYKLTVKSGDGDGMYEAGDTVTVIADEPMEGSEFIEWEVQEGDPTIDDLTSPTTELKMPEEDVVIKATYSKPADKYQLNVFKGLGDGMYAEGEQVDIIAIEPPFGTTFDGWNIISGSPEIKDPSDPTTTLIMPGEDATIEAVYVDIPAPEFKLTVRSGDGDGMYREGTTIPISADEAPNGKTFDEWKVTEGNPSIRDQNKPETNLKMPDEDVVVEATYKDLPPDTYELIVDDGDGDGTYPAGEEVKIEADDCPIGEEFEKWVVRTGSPEIEDIRDPTTTLTMPATNTRVTVQCVEVEILYELVVNDGSGDGNYPKGTDVPLVAEDCPLGEEFDMWKVEKGNPIIDDPKKSSTTLIMREGDAEVSRICKPTLYTLAVEDGDGDGVFPAGTETDIVADDAGDGAAFDKWLVVSGEPVIDDESKPATTLTMPFADVVVKATYVGDAFYDLVVDGGFGDGSYPGGTSVPIRAGPCPTTLQNPPVFRIFDKWEIVEGSPTIADVESSSTVLTMPDENATVRAVCKDAPIKDVTLTVDGGSGDGDYPPGSTVDIVAEECPTGSFEKWEVTKGDATVVDGSSPSTTVVMGGDDSTVTRRCQDLPEGFKLTVINGIGDGEYGESAEVPIRAARCETSFDTWIIVSGSPSIADLQSESTTLIMPGEDVTVQAICIDEPVDTLYELIIDDGSGDGFYKEGEEVEIVADECPEGEEFRRWALRAGDPEIEDQDSAITIVTMPANDARVRRTCREIQYELTVINGKGDGTFPAGSRNPIVADEIDGERFVEWKVNFGDPDIVDRTAANTEVIMPAADAEVQAFYEVTVELFVTGGSGSGNYTKGEEVEIVADPCPELAIEPPQPQKFDKWLIVTGDATIDFPQEKTAYVTMGDEATSIEAVCTPEVFELVVVNGRGDGTFPAGSENTITADDIPRLKFDKWSIGYGAPDIIDDRAESTTLIMPAEDVEVTAEYVDLYELDVQGGTGSGNYTDGEEVDITADPCPMVIAEPPRMQRFSTWIIDTGDATIDDPLSNETFVTMKDTDVVVRAICIEVEYELIVINGNGDGFFQAGSENPIAADERDRQQFVEWIVGYGNPTIEDVFSESTILIMPAEDVEVAATYVDTYELTVINGTGDGNYTANTTVEVSNDPCPEETPVFSDWLIVQGSPDIIRSNNSGDALVIMPEEDVVIEAVCTANLNPCNTTDEARTEELLALLIGVSGAELVESEGTPQNQAADWLINNDEYFVCPGVNDKKIVQRYIMAVFYFSTSGPEWKECFDGDASCGTQDNDFEGQKFYLAPVNECEWAGSTCDESLCIEAIIFEEDNNVAGTVPFEFGDLDILQVISLESQLLTGTIPETLSKPPMRIIDFDFNRLTGTIPESIYTLTGLEQLDLNNNELTGSLSDSIGGLTSLIFLQLHFNQFTGGFPTSLLDTPLLVGEFQNNNFAGSMPLCIGAPGQTVGAISVDCGPASGAPVTCGEGCGCECF